MRFYKKEKYWEEAHFSHTLDTWKMGGDSFVLDRKLKGSLYQTLTKGMLSSSPFSLEMGFALIDISYFSNS